MLDLVPLSSIRTACAGSQWDQRWPKLSAQRAESRLRSWRSASWRVALYHNSPDLMTEIYEPLLNDVEAARFLGGLHSKTVQRMARRGELLALKWADVHFDKREIRPCRAIVDQVIGSLKTEASGKAVPMDAALAEALLDWRARCPYNQDADYIFGSPEMNGTQPYWPDSLLRKVIRPAAVRAGISKHIGWHSFRRTLSTLLEASGASVKVTQDMLRHASSRLTMDLYAQSIPADRRKAQSGVIGAVLAASVPKRSLINSEVVVGA